MYCCRHIIKSRNSRPHICGDFDKKSFCSLNSCMLFEPEFFFELVYEKDRFYNSILTHSYQSVLMHLTWKTLILYHPSLLADSAILHQASGFIQTEAYSVNSITFMS